MHLSPDTFLLQAAEEGYGQRIVITVAAPVHAGLQIVLVQKPKPFIAAVLRPKVSEDTSVSESVPDLVEVSVGVALLDQDDVAIRLVSQG